MAEPAEQTGPADNIGKRQSCAGPQNSEKPTNAVCLFRAAFYRFRTAFHVCNSPNAAAGIHEPIATKPGLFAGGDGRADVVVGPVVRSVYPAAGPDLRGAVPGTELSAR